MQIEAQSPFQPVGVLSFVKLEKKVEFFSINPFDKFQFGPIALKNKTTQADENNLRIYLRMMTRSKLV